MNGAEKYSLDTIYGLTLDDIGTNGSWAKLDTTLRRARHDHTITFVPDEVVECEPTTTTTPQSTLSTASTSSIATTSPLTSTTKRPNPTGSTTSTKSTTDEAISSTTQPGHNALLYDASER